MNDPIRSPPETVTRRARPSVCEAGTRLLSKRTGKANIRHSDRYGLSLRRVGCGLYRYLVAVTIQGSFTTLAIP